MIACKVCFLYTDSDFNSPVKVVKFSAGQTNASVCILIYDDCVMEGNETFSVF